MVKRLFSKSKILSTSSSYPHQSIECVAKIKKLAKNATGNQQIFLFVAECVEKHQLIVENMKPDEQQFRQEWEAYIDTLRNIEYFLVGEEWHAKFLKRVKKLLGIGEMPKIYHKLTEELRKTTQSLVQETCQQSNKQMVQTPTDAVAEQIMSLQKDNNSDMEFADFIKIDFTQLKNDVYEPELVLRGSHNQIQRMTYLTAPVAVRRIDSVKSEKAAIYGGFAKQMFTFTLLGECPHIARFYGTTVDDGNLYTVSDWAEYHDLQRHLKTNPRLTWSTKIRITQQLSEALNFCHRHNILHHDVRSCNVLLNEDLQVKLSNFDLALLHEEQRKFSSISRPTDAYRWTAPEKLQGAKIPYTKEMDVYSFSIVMWEIATQKIPFEHITNDVEVAMKVARGTKLELPIGAPEKYTLIMQDGWDCNPDARPTMSKISDVLARLMDKTKQLDSTKYFLSHAASPSIDVTNNSPLSESVKTSLNPPLSPTLILPPPCSVAPPPPLEVTSNSLSPESIGTSLGPSSTLIPPPCLVASPPLEVTSNSRPPKSIGISLSSSLSSVDETLSPRIFNVVVATPKTPFISRMSDPNYLTACDTEYYSNTSDSFTPPRSTISSASSSPSLRPAISSASSSPSLRPVTSSAAPPSAPPSRSTSPSPSQYMSDVTACDSDSENGSCRPRRRSSSSHPAISLEEAKSLFEQKQYSDAFEAFTKIHRNTKVSAPERADAEYHLGLYFYTGEYGREKNETKAINFFLKAATQNREAQFLYGKLCCTQGGKNIARGVENIRKAADAGHVEAMRMYGTILYEGKYQVPMNCREGQRYINKANEEDKKARGKEGEIFVPTTTKRNHRRALSDCVVMKNRWLADFKFQNESDEKDTKASPEDLTLSDCVVMKNRQLADLKFQNESNEKDTKASPRDLTFPVHEVTKKRPRALSGAPPVKSTGRPGVGQVTRAPRPRSHIG